MSILFDNGVSHLGGVHRINGIFEFSRCYLTTDDSFLVIRGRCIYCSKLSFPIEFEVSVGTVFQRHSCAR